MGRRKKPTDSHPQAKLLLFNYWTIDDWDAFIVLTKHLISLLRQKSFEMMKEKVAAIMAQGEVMSMPERTTNYDTSASTRQDTEQQQQQQPEPEAQQRQALITAADDIKLNTLAVDVYRHLTTIARLFERLCDIYPDLKADLLPSVHEWIVQLDKDCQTWFDFSILEGEESEPE